MSDPSVEPGAPKSTAASPGDIDRRGAVPVKIPGALARAVAAPDRVLLRLNKLLATPGGLSSFLSTANYALYLLTYLEAKSTGLRLRLSLALQILLAKLLSRPLELSIPPQGGPSHIATLAALLSGTRTTLRLFGLLPLYAWAKQLLQGRKEGQDGVLYATAATQCAMYIGFQTLENIAFLTDRGVLPPRPSGTARLHTLSTRFWLAGVLCDFVRLGREAQLTRLARLRRSFSEKVEVGLEAQDRAEDAKWWAQVVVPLGWTPVAVQYSVEGGAIAGWNLGIMGLSGGLAGLGRTAELWAGTK